ncbi:MAG: hypothetical protein HOE47_01240 [Candidatus Marinimicrobia bacterium]|nr:hypothetical protein [Candidatus Neomarinimicrobiota bacterium]
MIQFPKFKLMRFPIITAMALFFIACPGSESIVENVEPIQDVQFTYHQEVGELYFSAEISEQNEESFLASVSVLWFGIDSNRTADTLTLNDEGVLGDILFGDGIYGLKILNDTTVIQHVITASDFGSVYFKLRAEYGSSVVTYSDSSALGNLLPSILSVVFPDTMTRPTEENIYHIDSIFVSAHDPNGLDDIQSCFLMFKKPDGSYANNGDPIVLYDDGTQYPDDSDNPSFWDLLENDGIYSRLITIGSTNPLGTYEATFTLKDWSGLFVEEVKTLEVIE